MPRGYRPSTHAHATLFTLSPFRRDPRGRMTTPHHGMTSTHWDMIHPLGYSPSAFYPSTRDSIHSNGMSFIRMVLFIHRLTRTALFTPYANDAPPPARPPGARARGSVTGAPGEPVIRGEEELARRCELRAMVEVLLLLVPRPHRITLVLRIASAVRLAAFQFAPSVFVPIFQFSWWRSRHVLASSLGICSHSR